jgi:phage terminase large subunit-like protein
MGLDLSSTTDLSALALVFPPQRNIDDWRVIWYSWIPEEGMKERIMKDHVPYDLWLKAGWITATPGEVVDYTKIESKILELAQIYNVIELDADMHFASMLIQRLEQAGIPCVDIPQTFLNMTNPINETEVLIRDKKITHENNLVARWCFGNASVAKNGNGNVKFVKEHKGKSVVRTKRIDLMVSWVNAMSRAVNYTNRGSVYDSRDLLML